MTDLIFLRCLLVILLTTAAWLLRPFALEPGPAAFLGLALGGFALLSEWRLRLASLPRLMGAVAGALVALASVSLAVVSLRLALPEFQTLGPFGPLALLLLLVYVGLVVGASKGELLNLSALRVFGRDESPRSVWKLLDTSVIIDGRIADVAETGFLDGTLVVPQFVLQELQLVADSADALKRNRGRRGLDVLQRLQHSTKVRVEVLSQDVPHTREVDMKLIELALEHGCPVVTNDFNLNKVARVRGVTVLSLNELANALRPVVLPGETMTVLILKEGKEYNQGVAYLDDGTMVVVDNARRLIGKTIEVVVTSVLQTTAGKMIFGRLDDRTPARAGAELPERSGSREVPHAPVPPPA